MNPLAHLLLAALALHAAAAASIPAPASIPELSKHDDLINKDASLENDVNNLRVKPEDIPVQVVIEEVQPAVKTNEVSDEIIEDKERLQIDLKNPGPPQRQEHENQSADQFTEAQQKLTAVQESIVQTENVLRQGVKGVTDDISHWLTTNEQIASVQQNIQSLRESFAAQIQKLTEAIQKLAAPQKVQETSDQAQDSNTLKEVESSIKNLENHFDNGVRALSEGVSVVAILRAEDASQPGSPAEPAAPVAPAAPIAPANPPAQNILSQFVTNFQQGMNDQFQNVRDVVANFLNRNNTTTAPSTVLSDTPAATPGQTPIISNIITQFQSIQSAFQNQVANALSFIPGIGNNQGSSATPAASANQPVKATLAQAAPAPAPALAPAPAPAPAAAPAPAPAPAAQPAVGPIRQIVQRIQNNLNNPVKPRDPATPVSQTKGGVYYGGHRPGQGDSDSVDGGLKASPEELVKEIKQELEKPQELPAPVVSDKTE